MSDELKPCPFCGGRVALFEAVDGDFYPACENKKDGCYVCGTLEVGEKASITRWNTRPIENALRAENAKLKARVEAAVKLVDALRWHLKEEHMASRNLFSGKITPGHREAQAACYAASAAWEDLK